MMPESKGLNPRVLTHKRVKCPETFDSNII